MSGRDRMSDYHHEFDKQTLSINKQRTEASPTYLITNIRQLY